MKYLYILLSIICFVNISCKKKEHPVNFYYWKSNVSIDNTEKMYFERLHSKRMYIRFFDVDIENSEILPKSKINLFDPGILKTEYVPVIFITNRTFIDITDYSLEQVVKNTLDLVNHICEKNNISDFSEIQIDCDWTGSTQKNYFRFLSLLKQLSGKTISCTLRLHQIKFKDKTGIPPVDRAVLMCYATSNPDDNSDKNSILDIPLLKDYTSDINSYPLVFDIALPLYSWAIVTNHLGKIKLLNNVTKSEMDSTFFRLVKDNEYEAKNDFFFHGIYINKGFTFKTEDISPELLNEAKNYLAEKINKDYSIVYYHLDKPFLERFTIDELK